MKRSKPEEDVGGCDKCYGAGAYCWTCGEVEEACECEEGRGNIGVCEYCETRQ